MTSDKTSENPSPPPPPPPPPHDPVTFQGVANYYQPPQPPPSHVSIGMPYPALPHGPAGNLSPYYSLGYQIVPDYMFDEARYQPEHPLPCCGIGIGWLLFLLGFLFGAIPWYIGTFMLICVSVDNREKPGLIACLIAVIIAVFLLTSLMTIANQLL